MLNLNMAWVCVAGLLLHMTPNYYFNFNLSLLLSVSERNSASFNVEIGCLGDVCLKCVSCVSFSKITFNLQNC